MINWIRIFAIGMAIGLMPAGPAHAEEAGSLVLVVNARSDMRPLTLQEVRKIYLGASMVVNGQVVKPLLNLSDETLYEVFLQKVMFMSAQAYQRQLVRRFLHAQGRRPVVYRDQARLLAALAGDPYAVTYVMRMDEAENHADLRILTVLWDGTS